MKKSIMLLMGLLLVSSAVLAVENNKQLMCTASLDVPIITDAWWDDTDDFNTTESVNLSIADDKDIIEKVFNVISQKGISTKITLDSPTITLALDGNSEEKTTVGVSLMVGDERVDNIVIDGEISGNDEQVLKKYLAAKYPELNYKEAIRFMAAGSANFIIEGDELKVPDFPGHYTGSVAINVLFSE